MENNEYKCALCGGIFTINWTDGWSEEDAKKEAVENFGKELVMFDTMDTVCDECYLATNPKDYPEEVEAAKEIVRQKIRN